MAKRQYHKNALPNILSFLPILIAKRQYDKNTLPSILSSTRVINLCASDDEFGKDINWGHIKDANYTRCTKFAF